MSTALFPGSFDPFHYGHLDVVEQAHALFGNVIVCAMVNPQKPSGMFTAVERLDMIIACIRHLPGASVANRFGLVVDAARDLSVDFIVKGLRTVSDFETETTMAHTNHVVGGVRTVFVPCDPARGFVSSSYIRDISRYGGDVSGLVPPPVLAGLRAKNPTT